MSTGIHARAHAKINWDLRILGRRADNFHELDSIFVNIDLSDDLTITAAEETILSCSDPTLPVDDSNLVMKAVRFLADEACNESSRERPGAKIHLIKNIPMGGGMGGGSSDAACTLVALNKLWHLNWSRERLARIAAQIGSDVAYFLYGGWCLCRGRGEIVERLFSPEIAPAAKILMVLPPLHVPTPAVYKALNASTWDGTGARCARDAAACVLQKLNAEHCAPLGLRNDLAEVARKVEPRLAAVQEVLEKFFPGRWLMSGSGASHFAVPPSDCSFEKKKELQAALENAVAGTRVIETRTMM